MMRLATMAAEAVTLAVLNGVRAATALSVDKLYLPAANDLA